MSPGFSRSYDDWLSTEPEHQGGGGGRLAVERGWWHGFHAARREGRAEEYLEEYAGIDLYKVLCEDAKRRLETDLKVLVRLDVNAGEPLEVE